MYLDLSQFHKFFPDVFVGSLVVRIEHGDVYQYPKNNRKSILPFSVRPRLFQLRPEGPHFEDEDADGWEFSLHVTDEKRLGHDYYALCLRREAGVWVVRYQSRGMNLLDIVLPDFNPSQIETIEDRGEPQDVWSRLDQD
jgi:hypothetical protein